MVRARPKLKRDELNARLGASSDLALRHRALDDGAALGGRRLLGRDNSIGIDSEKLNGPDMSSGMGSAPAKCLRL